MPTPKLDPKTLIPILYATRLARGSMSITADENLSEVQRHLRNANSSLPVEQLISTRLLRAWLLDRAEQYTNDSGYRCVFDELLTGLAHSEPTKAFAHGELDDLLSVNS